MLGVAFPVGPGEEPLIALPLTLPMGWTESPPYFCSATETLVDLINLHASPSWDPPWHPLEPAAGTQPPQDGRHCISIPTPTFSPPPRLLVLPQLPPPQQHHHCRPLAYGDVFVDDEILLAQGTPTQLHHFKRQALHINDWIFRANNNHDNPTVRKEPISKSKLLKGDACWSTTKVILGWTLDTLCGTIELPAHWKTRLQDILTNALHCKRVSVQAWQKLLGQSSEAWSWGSLVARVYSPSSKLPFNARPTTESESTRKPRSVYRTFTPLHKIWCSAPLEWPK